MKICIARVDRMGDMILTLPIIKGLKILDKSNIIHVIASDRNYKIVKHFNYIDKIYLLSSSKNNFFSIINKIRKEKIIIFNHIEVSNLNSFIINLLVKLSKLPVMLYEAAAPFSIFKKNIHFFFSRIKLHGFNYKIYLFYLKLILYIYDSFLILMHMQHMPYAYKDKT